VRYGALSGLNKIAHFLHGSKEKAGLRSAAWSLITSMQVGWWTICFTELTYSVPFICRFRHQKCIDSNNWSQQGNNETTLPTF